MFFLWRTKYGSTSQMNHIFSVQVSSLVIVQGQGERFPNSDDANMPKSKKVESLLSIKLRVLYLPVLEKLEMKCFKIPVCCFVFKSVDGILHHIWLNPVM